MRSASSMTIDAMSLTLECGCRIWDTARIWNLECLGE